MRNRPGRRGFTLVEILVVLTIILLVAVIAIPPTFRALNGRQVTDAARIFQGALAGIRDAAIKANEPRGIRLMPDPVLTIPAPGLVGAGTTQLVYNRMVPIEPAGDYSEGRINIGPVPFSTATFPPAYPGDGGGAYPFPDTTSGLPKVLMVEEAPFQGGFVTPTGFPNTMVNWCWNVRLGDKIRINNSGRSYTVVGPCTISPWGLTSATQGNPELFVNVGPPGTTSPLQRTYWDTNGNPFARQFPVEFLFLVNGEDDDNDGYIDEGWNNYNENPPWPPTSVEPMPTGYVGDTLTDSLSEWETEKWVGAFAPEVADLNQTAVLTPSLTWATSTTQHNLVDQPYIISRRPVPTQSAREIPLPGGVVIDATTWNSTRERSRLPVTPGSLYCDIMVNPNGQFIPTTAYSTPASAGDESFVHFWLAESQDIYPRGAVWGTGATGPNPNPSATDDPPQIYELPMTTDALGLRSGTVIAGKFYPPPSVPLAPVLKGERRLITFFKQSGTIVQNTIESILPPSAFLPGEGFNVNDVGYPYRKAQVGQREAK